MMNGNLVQRHRLITSSSYFEALGTQNNGSRSFLRRCSIDCPSMDPLIIAVDAYCMLTCRPARRRDPWLGDRDYENSSSEVRTGF